MNRGRTTRRLTRVGLTLPMLLFFLIPLVALLLRTQPGAIFASLSEPLVSNAIRLSLVTSSISTVLIILFGTPLAYQLARRPTPFRRFLDTLVDLPTVLPPAVAGIALLMAFGRRGLFGPWLSALGIELPFTSAAVVLAQIFIAAPLYIKPAAVGLAGIDCELKQAAALDGATRWQSFRYISLPLAWPALVSGIVSAWARALGEFGATIIFAGNFPGRTQTMPLSIYIGFETNLDTALTLSVILIGTSFFTLLLVKLLLLRKIDS